VKPKPSLDMDRFNSDQAYRSLWMACCRYGWKRQIPAAEAFDMALRCLDHSTRSEVELEKRTLELQKPPVLQLTVDQSVRALLMKVGSLEAELADLREELGRRRP